MTEQTVPYTPLDAPLPPVSTEEVFTELQWRTLLSLADTVIPSVRGPRGRKSRSAKVVSQERLDSALSALKATIPGPDAAALATQYLEESLCSIPKVRQALQLLFTQYVHQEGKNGLSFVLTALNTKAGSLMLTGSITPIQNQPFDVREQIFQSWSDSRLPPVRAIYRALTAIFKRTWVTFSPALYATLGVPLVPVHGVPKDGFKFEFLQFPPSEKPEIIETDIVIIGSGCGGSVAAKNLAEAGHRVIVTEKAYSFTSRHFPMKPHEGFNNMFDAAGTTMNDEGSMGVLYGSTWGGGGYVRQEWAEKGLPLFTTWEFQKSLDRVCDRMGVSAKFIKHNPANRMILEGARQLGYAAQAVPQNTGGTVHYCGYCTLGCHSTGKKGPTETFLADAANAGATFIEGFKADRVLFSKTKTGQVASGVVGTWTSRDAHFGVSGVGSVKRKVIIKAKKVIVSCGSLHSPLLLLRSGIKNYYIGRNLHLHPVAIATAVFQEATRPWEGACLTTVVNEFEDLDGKGHGVKLEGVSMLPGAILPILTWRDGLDYKLQAAKLSHSAGFITLTKERDPGRVYPDPHDGRVRIDYSVSAFDRKHILEGLIASAKIAYISGAKEIHTSFRDMPPFIRPEEDVEGSPDGTNSPALQAWITEFRRKGLSSEKVMFASAHQMGSCRMGSSARNSVVDPEGQVWRTQGLYVADASVFPSASGVNPMITNMAISDYISRNLIALMEKKTTRL
ncbi:hypothetical protein ARAM_006451 [Aspergillus rambellii]|uniref:Long-chain-alcohol oxidase n=1 Tax=Aspergillus rambellii TaxID=308745 RepID=A0A0F8UV90_9EURO|nr:hypothetical protein ARAM_006451 [Aspergillus rambellii]